MSSGAANKFTAIPSTDGGGGGEALQPSKSSESQEQQSAVTLTVNDILQQIESNADQKHQETESNADPKPQETESSADQKPQEIESTDDPKIVQIESSVDPKPQHSDTTAPVERPGHEIKTLFTQQQGGSNEPEMIDFCSAERITLVRRIRIPHPSFKGTIIGRGGETIAAMRKTYQCKLLVLGAGSTKDAEGERTLLESGAEEHQHLAEPLHIKIECSGPSSVVYPRVQAAMEIFNQLFNEGNGSRTMGAPIQTQTPRQQRPVPLPTHHSTPAPFDSQQGYRAHMKDPMAMDVSVPPPLQHPQQLGSVGRAMGRVTTGTGGGGVATHTYRGGVQKRERPTTVGQGSYQQQGQQTWSTGQSGGRGGTSNFDHSHPMRGNYGSSGGGLGRGAGSDYSNPTRGGYGTSSGRGGTSNSDYSNPMRGGYGTSSGGGGGRGSSSQTRGGPQPGYGGRGGTSYH